MSNSSTNEPDSVYRVLFLQQDKMYDVYAKNIYQSDIYGFIEVEDFLFGEDAKQVVDPTQEKIKKEFEHIGRVFIPMHAVLRIDEVQKQGVAKIKDMPKGTGKLMQFPYTPPSAE